VTENKTKKKKNEENRSKKEITKTNQEPFQVQQHKVEPTSRRNYVTSSTVQIILHTECIPSLQYTAGSLYFSAISHLHLQKTKQRRNAIYMCQDIIR